MIPSTPSTVSGEGNELTPGANFICTRTGVVPPQCPPVLIALPCLENIYSINGMKLAILDIHANLKHGHFAVK